MNDIDLVIPWVDGSDLNWLSRKNLYKQGNDSIKTADVQGRFRDNEELRYLLRSIERHYPVSAPRIFLVVDRQIPDWLDTTKVTIVNHDEFIPDCYLPLFSSRAIESFFHRIPGISDYFLCLNDDFFFGCDVTYDHLFSGGRVKNYFTRQKIGSGRKKDISVNHFANINAAIMANRFVYNQYGFSFPWIPAHAPQLVEKQFVESLEKGHPQIFSKVRSGRFREYDSQSIIASLYPALCVATGKGSACFDDIFYMGNNDRKARSYYNHLLNNDYYGVCINDTSDNLSPDSQIFKDQYDFYQSRFPSKSIYEI